MSRLWKPYLSKYDRFLFVQIEDNTRNKTGMN